MTCSIIEKVIKSSPWRQPCPPVGAGAHVMPWNYLCTVLIQ